jgi:hypothetical protein
MGYVGVWNPRRPPFSTPALLWNQKKYFQVRVQKDCFAGLRIGLRIFCTYIYTYIFVGVCLFLSHLYNLDICARSKWSLKSTVYTKSQKLWFGNYVHFRCGWLLSIICFWN